MKMTMIGHCCVDVFHRADGTEERALGGMFHAVSAMANLAADRDTIFPVFGIGEGELEMVKGAFGGYKNVDLSGVFTYAGPSNTVHYYDDNPNERSLDIAPAIPYSRIKKFLNVDGVSVNMVSGRDIAVDTMDEIRLEVRGKKVPLHLDMHCLTLQVHADGTRSFRSMEEWRRWCFMTDIVQMNEQEAAEMSIEHFSDELLAKQMIPLMVQAFIITRGAKGATFYREVNKHLSTEPLTHDAPGPVVSTLGAGDIFGAAMLFAYLKKKNLKEAAQFAQMAASHSTAFPLTEKHRQLKGLRELL